MEDYGQQENRHFTFRKVLSPESSKLQHADQASDLPEDVHALRNPDLDEQAQPGTVKATFINTGLCRI
jgi:hypothetical protein